MQRYYERRKPFEDMNDKLIKGDMSLDIEKFVIVIQSIKNLIILHSNEDHEKLQAINNVFLVDFTKNALSSQTAWLMIKESNRNCRLFQNYLLDYQLATKELVGSPSIVEVFNRALSDKIFPGNYEEVIKELIMMYQGQPAAYRKAGFDYQLSVIDVIINLLFNNREFRMVFSQDQALVPFFGDGFWGELAQRVQSYEAEQKFKNEILTYCIERKITPESLDKELIHIFGYKEQLSPEQQDFIHIQKFLSNTKIGSTVLKYLKQFEEELEQFAQPRFDVQTQLLTDAHELSERKILFRFFKKWLKQNGFAGYAEYKELIDIDKFYGTLAQCGLFKDNIFSGKAHGDYTHFIQWYLIIMLNNENLSKPKLNCSPQHLLQWIGINRKYEEWQFNFEVVNKPTLFRPNIDFRSAFKLNDYILATRNEFPLLSLILERKSKKEAPSMVDRIDKPAFIKF